MNHQNAKTERISKLITTKSENYSLLMKKVDFLNH